MATRKVAVQETSPKVETQTLMERIMEAASTKEGASIQIKRFDQGVNEKHVMDSKLSLMENIIKAAGQICADA